MRNYRHLPSGSVARARELRRNRTEAEKRLWGALRRAFPREFRFQVPYGSYFADFLSFNGKLIVEVDGGTHAETPEYDAARTRYFEGEGYRLIRFWNNDVMANTDGVIAEIAAQLPSPSGRGREPQSGGRVRVNSRGKGRANPSPSPAHVATRRGPLPLPPGEGK